MSITQLATYGSIITADDTASNGTLVKRDTSGNIAVNAIAATALALTKGLTLPFTSKTANYTATADDVFIFCDATGGAITITLPPVASVSGKVLWIMKTDTSSNTVTVDGNASETINAATTYVIAGSARGAVMIVCDSTQWWAPGKF